MNYDYIIPKPKKVQPGNGFFEKADELAFYNEFDSQKLSNVLQQISAQKAAAQDDANLFIRKTEEPISSKNNDEAYCLEIEKDKISVSATTERGAFYGIKTLKQLLSQNKSLQSVKIEDWPELKMRAMHLTLGSGNMPTFERLKKIIGVYADYKVNAFVIEYDDRFPWEKHPVVAHKDSLTKPQLRELIELAENNFIEVIPLLDSLGHAQQYLIHEEYAHLKELPDEIAEMCPNNPQTMEFMKDLWEEVLELHKNSRFAHITGDEVFRMGDFCPKCREYAEKGTLAELFTRYYKDLSRWIISKGKTPIIWGDMLIKYPEYMNEFPRDIYINDWCYMDNDKDYWEYCRDRKNPEGIASEERDRLFNPYWHQDGSEKFTPYPFFKFFTDNGFKTIASTAVGREGDTAYPVSGFHNRFANNKRFPQSAAKNNGEGLIATFWSGSGMLEATWFGTIAGADFSWSPRSESYGEYARRFSVNFLNMDESFARKIMALDKKLYEDENDATPEELAAPFIENIPENAGEIQEIYLRILKEIDSLYEIDVEIKNLQEKTDRLFVGEGIDSQIFIENAANSSVSNCMPLEAPDFSMEAGPINAFGVKFDLNPQKIITLSKSDPRFKEEMPPVKINGKYERLFILNTGHSAPSGEFIASLRIRYSNGSSAKIPFIAGDNTADWWGAPKNIEDGTVGWQGNTKCSKNISAYMSVIDNPHPEENIEDIIFEPASKKARLIIFGITLRSKQKTGATHQSYQEIQNAIAAINSKLQNLRSDLQIVYERIMSSGDAEVAMNKLMDQRYNALKNLVKKSERTK